jgi:cytochrome c oxidase cbb3-type subunit 3
VTLADATGIAEGDKIYHSNCFACHGAKGEGGVGPNLTDNYWLHGGTINDIFKTIKIGVPEKGMQAWDKTYSPDQIKNLASYIKTLAGTNPGIHVTNYMTTS